jgi:hypothetical protein
VLDSEPVFESSSSISPLRIDILDAIAHFPENFLRDEVNHETDFYLKFISLACVGMRYAICGQSWDFLFLIHSLFIKRRYDILHNRIQRVEVILA